MSLYFQFDFNQPDHHEQPLVFANPKQMWQTSAIDEVIPLLKEVEQAHHNGLYVAGYLAYEAAPAFDDHFDVKKNDQPLLLFASFDAPSVKRQDKALPYYVHPWHIDEDEINYQEKIHQIKEAIRQGDTYQVNYTVRLFSRFFGDPYGYYLTLKDKQQANYSAYLKHNHQHILSLSPELFFHVNESRITTKPMKGTSKRGDTLEEDRQNKQHLTSSEKERAENMMIVDLLRNDLGRLATKGSVNVSQLLSVETYPTVHQMTSTIEATLDETSGLIDWFRALFPCGSITGAPKIKTMSYINALEESPRGVYCGTIGYLTPNKEAIFNVPIRTVTINELTHEATYGVGGGITWDSIDTAEYDEVHTKAKVLDIDTHDFSLLESFCLKDGVLQRFSQHMNRLTRASEVFGYPLDLQQIKQAKHQLQINYPTGQYKVRWLVDKTGHLSVDVLKIKELTTPVICYLAKQPIAKNHLFSRYKTTNRKHYQACEVSGPTNFSTLLYNEDNELTEFTIGNVILQINGVLYTPPVSSGCLPGIYRETLLDKGEVTEKVLTLRDLKESEKVYLTNSVRGMVEVSMKSAHS
ncbi:aminodeoxychorismate synthase, component I [Halolactibacillus miurensis]|uniref:Aminodeoxychorismate synthase, component I n=2 Tax=Halolactibacillus TaxID=306539 RepID=A0A1I6RID6_9BACI|nr:aminodeoxychorismate synthase component I [Halolactibacillus miurensis]GEM03921.1 aminodeoxychorismate synthase, component I [Halolactibacillus miurensis]SFS64477.1 para-aminobenzoate synthetase / 4-amino-4-deoxychorismate lyase [Halolactibacillus miurensis]